MIVGLIGLGRMGVAMARRLIAEGAEVHGHDLDDTNAARAREAGVHIGATAGDVAAATEILILSLPNAGAVEQALFGEDGAVIGGSAPRVVIDTSTIRPDEGRAVAGRLEETGMAYLDAPVSGGPAGAEAGTLTMMLGGTAEARERAEPALALLAGKRITCGGVGNGQAVKLVNNALVAAHLALAREALALGQALGLDEEALVDALNGSSGRSAVTEVNLPEWVLSGRFDSGFSAGLMRKDVGLALTAAEAKSVPMPLIEKAATLWRGAADVPDEADFNRIVRAGL